MKRTIVFTFLVFLFIVAAKATTTDIDLYKDPIPPGPVPLSLRYLIVSATIEDTDLAVYFDQQVDNATITIYDSSNKIVYQDVIDTSSESEVFIPTTLWSSGDYSITISYNTTNLKGNFQIQ